jgi:hypothetical protein
VASGLAFGPELASWVSDFLRDMIIEQLGGDRDGVVPTACFVTALRIG